MALWCQNLIKYGQFLAKSKPEMYANEWTLNVFPLQSINDIDQLLMPERNYGLYGLTRQGFLRKKTMYCKWWIQLSTEEKKNCEWIYSSSSEPKTNECSSLFRCDLHKMYSITSNDLYKTTRTGGGIQGKYFAACMQVINIFFFFSQKANNNFWFCLQVIPE